jgi:enoyl-CoA hydratase/carnithine racemase
VIIDEQKLGWEAEAKLGRRDVLALAGAAVASGLAAAPAVAQSAPVAAPTAPAQSQTKATVVLDRPAKSVLTIGIDRPDAQNRIDIPTFSAIGQAYYQFEHDDDLRVAVLYGKGPDFSQGLDQASWAAALGNGPFQPLQNFIDPVATAGPERSKPLIVAVQGRVTRVAHELFLAADLRVAAQDAVFNQGEVTAASFPGGGATVRFVREAGWGNAMHYMLTGEDWHADEAHRMGLVQVVTPPGQQLDCAVDLAKQIAAYAPLGIQALLGSARRSFREGERVALLSLQPEFGRLSRSEDRQEYFRALQEKRSPVYVGR